MKFNCLCGKALDGVHSCPMPLGKPCKPLMAMNSTQRAEVAWKQKEENFGE